MADGVFISYRQSDSKVAVEHLTPRLTEHFGSGQIYRDLDSNRPGFDFIETIAAALDAAAVVLVMIGPRWVTATSKAGGHRLDDPNDFIRCEIEQALRNRKHVIPVLVDSGEMPLAEDLPDSLQPLVRRHSVRLRSTDWTTMSSASSSTLSAMGFCRH